MEKRLIDTYDHMTMPEECARRIENRLEAELESKKSGRYTKFVVPHSPKSAAWKMAVACLALVVVIGGAGVLFLNGMKITSTDPAALYTDTELAEAVQSTTPKDYYHSVTSLSAEEVESFAKVVRYLILTENWWALAGKIQYPITVEEKVIPDEETFIAFMKETSLGSHFLMAMKYESCVAMWYDDEGIIMGDGQICISEAKRKQLKITHMCRLTETSEDLVHFTFTTYPDGTRALHQYTGYGETVKIPEILGNQVTTQIGSGIPVLVNGDVVKTVTVPASVTVVVENAFADSPALEAVFFEGDAPAEAENVFEGSDNVVVYYQQGANGWGDTWCGRKTMEYDGEQIPPETGTAADRIPALFEKVLSGSVVPIYGNGGDMTVEQYCANLWGADAEVDAFTLADMDDDGVYELIFAPRNAEGVTLGYLVLRQDGAKLCAYSLKGRDLHKDGTFYSFVLKGDSRIHIQDESSFVVMQLEEFSLQEKPLAQWHTYPCQGYGVVLESYHYASETGFSSHPGSPYGYLGTLLSGDADWNAVQPWLAQQSVYVETKGGNFRAFDPDAPGCVMYGFLTGTRGQQELTSLGYYICDETGEYRAEAFELETDSPVYTVAPPPDDRGREVDSKEAMQDYFGIDFYGSDISRDVQQIAELLDRFVARYSEHDTEGMQEYMAAAAGNISSYPFTGRVSILTYGILPDTAMNTGERWSTTVELLESGFPQANYHLDVILIKQNDGWKIQSYSIEEQ